MIQIFKKIYACSFCHREIKSRKDLTGESCRECKGGMIVPKEWNDNRNEGQNNAAKE